MKETLKEQLSCYRNAPRRSVSLLKVTSHFIKKKNYQREKTKTKRLVMSKTKRRS